MGGGEQMKKRNLKLKQAIWDRGFRQDWIADAIGKSPVTLSRIIHGHTKPTEAVRAALAKVLETPVEQLFDGEM
jgi:transcriptional regulator with XRE-family HTH domain